MEVLGSVATLYIGGYYSPCLLETTESDLWARHPCFHALSHRRDSEISMGFCFALIFKSLLNLLQFCFCFTFWFFGPRGILDRRSPTRVWTHSPLIERRSLNHWTAREVLENKCFNTLFNLEEDMIQTEMILNKFCLCVMCKFLRAVVLAGWEMGLGLEMLNFFPSI